MSSFSSAVSSASHESVPQSSVSNGSSTLHGPAQSSTPGVYSTSQKISPSSASSTSLSSGSHAVSAATTTTPSTSARSTSSISSVSTSHSTSLVSTSSYPSTSSPSTSASSTPAPSTSAPSTSAPSSSSLAPSSLSLPAAGSGSSIQQFPSSTSPAQTKSSPSTTSEAVNGGLLGAQTTTSNTATVNASSYRLITSTVMESNSVYLTITNSVAVPTGLPVSASQNVVATRSGFFANTGAVAGVFLAIGIVVALLAGLALCFMRRQRRRGQTRGRIGLPSPLPENPFEPEYSSPPMRTVLVSRTDARWSRPHTFHSSDGSDEKASFNYEGIDFALPIPGGAEPRSARTPDSHPAMYEGPFSDYHAIVPALASRGVTLSSSDMVHHAPRPNSPSPSSPSLYPVSEEGSECPSEYSPISPRAQMRVELPSPIQQSMTQRKLVVRDHRPLTPPTSTSSHSPSDMEWTTSIAENPTYQRSLLINRTMDHYSPAPVRPQRSVRRLL